MCAKLTAFLRKFFSLIIAILLAISTLVLVIGAGRVITLERNFGKAGFAHFLSIVVSIVIAICYLILHFVPRKAYRLLYALTGMLLLGMLLVGNSFGLSAPVVSDCGIDPRVFQNISNITDLGSVFWGVNADNETLIIGKLGQPVRYCGAQSALFAGAFLTLIFYVVALFDVQMVLLSRIKSKTYGERFVEMGISN